MKKVIITMKNPAFAYWPHPQSYTALMARAHATMPTEMLRQVAATRAS